MGLCPAAIFVTLHNEQRQPLLARPVLGSGNARRDALGAGLLGGGGRNSRHWRDPMERLLSRREKLYLCGRQGQSYAPLENATTAWLAPGRIDELLERNHTKYISARPDGRGCLADIPAAINDQLEWSEVYTPERRRRYITVSRAWARENNSARISCGIVFSARCWSARRTSASPLT